MNIGFSATQYNTDSAIKCVHIAKKHIQNMNRNQFDIRYI